jgi:hypothetical protein
VKPLFNIKMQSSDFLVYFLAPVLSVLLPASWSRALSRLMSGWRWLLFEEAVYSCERAAEYTIIPDPQQWMRRWRLVNILEARDLSLIMWGRGRAVYREIEGADAATETRDQVLLGMHWGPSIALLGLLNHKGLNPLIPYRPVEPSIFRQRPWFYLFLTRSVRYLKRSCGSRAFTIRGAGDVLRRELPLPGTSVIVLDAPPAPGRSTIDGQVLDRPVRFNAGFPEILDASGRQYRFYAISLKAEGELRTLELSPARRPESGEQLMGDFCRFMSRHIGADSAQWRIWSVADQFFHDPAPGAGSDASGG